MSLQGPMNTRLTVAATSLASMVLAYQAGSTDSAAAGIAYMAAALGFWIVAGLTMGLKPDEKGAA